MFCGYCGREVDEADVVDGIACCAECRAKRAEAEAAAEGAQEIVPAEELGELDAPQPEGAEAAAAPKGKKPMDAAKKKKVIIGAVAAAVVVVVAIVIAVVLMGGKESEAVQMVEDGDYESAVALVQSDDNWKDRDACASYAQAIVAMALEEGNPYKAKDYLNIIDEAGDKDIKNAKDSMDSCTGDDRQTGILTIAASELDDDELSSLHSTVSKAIPSNAYDFSKILALNSEATEIFKTSLDGDMNIELNPGSDAPYSQEYSASIPFGSYWIADDVEDALKIDEIDQGVASIDALDSVEGGNEFECANYDVTNARYYLIESAEQRYIVCNIKINATLDSSRGFANVLFVFKEGVGGYESFDDLKAAVTSAGTDSTAQWDLAINIHNSLY